MMLNKSSTIVIYVYQTQLVWYNTKNFEMCVMTFRLNYLAPLILSHYYPNVIFATTPIYNMNIKNPDPIVHKIDTHE